MSADRVAGLVLRWARLYTRGLPERVLARRLAELEAELHDHIAHERARGTGEQRIVAEIASRALRGLPADVA